MPVFYHVLLWLDTGRVYRQNTAAIVSSGHIQHPLVTLYQYLTFLIYKINTNGANNQDIGLN